MSGNYDPYYDILNQCFLFIILVLYGVSSYSFMSYKPHPLTTDSTKTQPIMNISTASMLSIVCTLGYITVITMNRNIANFSADG
jgi:hypothetical protein